MNPLLSVSVVALLGLLIPVLCLVNNLVVRKVILLLAGLVFAAWISPAAALLLPLLALFAFFASGYLAPHKQPRAWLFPPLQLFRCSGHFSRHAPAFPLLLVSILLSRQPRHFRFPLPFFR